MDHSTNSVRKINIAVLGSYRASDEENQIAYELGSKLAAYPLNVICGGQKGVMLSLAKGVVVNRNPNALQSKSCTTVGILPSSDLSTCNNYIDIAIPTGAGHLQNSILAMSYDFVIVIGGSAGTLTELCFAWQLKKPIALLGNIGWAQKLANQALDDRRNEPLPHFSSVDDIINWLPICHSQDV
jgi:uncharacterized protein (TIGR00725 family)